MARRTNGSLYRRRGRKSWVMSYHNSDGQRVTRVTGTSCKATSERLLAKVVADECLRKAGVIDATTDRIAECGRQPIDSHLTDFIAGLRAKRVTDKQAGQVESRVRRVLRLASIETIQDITPHRITTALGAIGDAGASIQTTTHYLRATKQLTRWLVTDRRVGSDPIQHLRGGNTDVDRRHVRRALTEAESDCLVQAAESGPTILKMPGHTRAMLYSVALGSGLRASELGSLTPSSFSLEADPPTITLRAGYSKHRREDVQPLQPDLAEMLGAWLVGKPTGEPVFRMPHKPVELVRRDLEAARVAWLEGGGDPDSDFLCYTNHAGEKADFHSLRHSFISRLVSSGASVKVCQELARHSSPALTIGRYSHTRLHDLTGALDSLPRVGGDTQQDQQRLRATGTDNVSGGGKLRGQHQGCISQPNGASRCVGEGDVVGIADEQQTPIFAGQSDDVRRGASLRRTGIEPVTFGSVDRCPTSQPVKPQALMSDATRRSAERTAVGVETTPVDGDLRMVCEAWSGLPDQVRAGIMAMVGACGGDTSGTGTVTLSDDPPSGGIGDGAREAT